MPTAGRPKITVRLNEQELRQFQAAAHNSGTTGAELARQLILNHISTDQATPVQEHGVIMSDGGVHVQPTSPETDHVAPLDAWIEGEIKVKGSRVVRRRILVVEDWHEIASEGSELDTVRPDRTEP